MFLRVWEYEVPADRVDGFVAAYGPTGDWARLFARGDGFVRTELYRSAGSPTRFITVDGWRSKAAWQQFIDRWELAYADLDAAMEPLAAGGTLLVEGSSG
ncbi:MAG TPA: antibiotic biosynthesis monooxygenase [Intrasporangium sp.]|uniref:antibiotic biosynthesis monooxygenase family protein n=1 Tax=Intrasporangium sp. TaxID=1925024 RepID=UPI002B45EB52|nr:antibiotic biosynthesis monooxygenase [Intrasporangium sp.]HKX65904.1 antibiotic biosynthesis monooxygenase [Intrasporangium sp.]